MTLSWLGATTPSSSAASSPYRDVAGVDANGRPDGYVYRQYQGGDLQILKSPVGGGGVSVTQASNPTAWTAITKQIGPYPGTTLTADQWIKIASMGTQTAAAVIGAVASSQRPRTSKKRSPSAPAPMPVVPVAAPATPGWIVPAVVVGGLAVVVMIASSSSSSKGH